MEKLIFKDYPEKTYIEIEGINYSYDFFLMLGNKMLLNQPFIIVERKNKTVTIEKYKLDEDMELLKDAKRMLKEHKQKKRYECKLYEAKIKWMEDIIEIVLDNVCCEHPLHDPRDVDYCLNDEKETIKKCIEAIPGIPFEPRPIDFLNAIQLGVLMQKLNSTPALEIKEKMIKRLEKRLKNLKSKK